MSYLDRCVSKKDLFFKKLKPSCNLIIFVLSDSLYIAYTLNEMKEILKAGQNHYIENTELQTFHCLPNKMYIDSTLKKCNDSKVNTMRFVKSENKFRTGFGLNKQVFDFYSVSPLSRTDIGSDEQSVFNEIDIVEKSDSDSEVEIDWIEVKKQAEKRKMIEDERKGAEPIVSDYTITMNVTSEIKYIKKFKNSVLEMEEWFFNDVLHRDNDLPVRIIYYQNGNKQDEFWLKHGIYHRENGPAQISYFSNGNIKQKVWWYNNNRVNVDKEQPTSIYFYDNPFSSKKEEIWYSFLYAKHRENRPALIAYYESGNVSLESWYKNGEFFREDDKPATVQYFDCKEKIISKELWQSTFVRVIRHNNLPQEIIYYRNGNKHYEKTHMIHDEAMIVTEFYENGAMKEQQWFHHFYTQNYDSNRFEKDLPARIQFYENGNIKFQCWFNNINQIHRVNNPAQIHFYENGIIRYEQWFQNGKKHREGDKPAEIEYLENGDRYETWYENDCKHRIDKPADIGFRKNGDKYYEARYENGVERSNNLPASIRYFENGYLETWVKNGKRLEIYYENGIKKEEKWL